MLATLLAPIASCDKAPPEPSQPQTEQAQEGSTLPEADLVASYFLWTPEEQLVGHRNIEKIFETRLVPAGGNSRPMARTDRELHVTFDFNDEQLTEDSFMELNNVVGLLIVEDGEIALERYRHDCNVNQRWMNFSMTKSISTTLVGTAIKERYINGLQDLQPITSPV